MADIQIVAEVVGQKKINSLIKSTQTLEGRVKTLSKAYQSGKIGPEQYQQGLTELRKAASKLYPTHQKASAVVTKLSKDYLAASKAQKEYTAAQKQEQAATRAYIQARREATEANRRFDAEQRKAAQAAKLAEQATQKYNQETERLKLQYNTTYRAAQSFKTQLRELGEAHSRGAISADRHEQQVRELKNEYRAFLKNGGGPMNQFGQIASKNTRVMKRFGAVGVQQLGYQIQDFAVQVQSGTSVLVALGQQGSQLLGIFGPAGAIAGMILAIGTGLAGAFMAAKDSANGATSAMESFDDKLKSARQAVANMASDLELLRSGFENTFELTLTQQVQTAQEKVEALESALGELTAGTVGRSFLEGIPLLGGLVDLAPSERIAAAKQALQSAKEELAVAQELLRQKKEQERNESIMNQLHEVRQDALKKQLEMMELSYSAGKNMRTAAEGIVSAFRAAAGVDFSGPIQKALNKAIAFGKTVLGKFMGGGYGYNPNQVGRSSGRGGPTAEQLQREDPRVQLAYQPGGTAGVPALDFGTSGSSGGGGGMSAAEKQAQEFNKARDALAGLVSQYDEGVERAERLRDAQITVNEAINAGVISADQGQQIMSDYIDSLKDAENPMQKIADTMRSSLGDAFMSIVDGSKSAGDAFKDMARLVLKQAFELLVIKPILDSLFGGGSGGGGGNFLTALFSANGNAFEKGGKVTAYANGGVVTAPTGFQHSGGLGVMGEAGPEAIMPLKRGKNGKLGVQVEGGSQQPVVINQSFNFAANGDDSVKRIIAQEAPKIANLTQKQILDQRARGGAFKTTFG